MFDQKFNPEFHWQMHQKKKNYKKFLIVFLFLILLLSIFFIFKRYYFVSGRNISLDQLVPEDTKVLLTIDADDILKNEKGYLIFETGLKDFLENNERMQSLVKGIGKDIYWLEKSSNSQAFLSKVEDISLVKESFNITDDNSDDIKFNNKIIYELSVDNVDNPFLPISENKVYITYLNDYLFCISNNLDFIKNVINKYKESLKIDYFGTIKDELASYFNEQRTLMLKVIDYDAMEDSLSWVRNLSFIIQEENNNASFVIKFKMSSRKVEILFNNSQDINQRFDINRIGEGLLDNYLVYYSNLGIEYNHNVLNLNDNLDIFLKKNIESLYNINLKEELMNSVPPYYFLVYPENNFLIISKELDKMKSIYRKILAYSIPQTRTMTLPDGTIATEYYLNPEIIDLKERKIGDLTWYYSNLPEDTDFNLLKYKDYYVLTNFKEKVIELSENQEKFCKILRCDKERSSDEILMLNLRDFNQKEYLPWLNLFLEEYNTLKLINLSENGQNKLFFELIH